MALFSFSSGSSRKGLGNTGTATGKGKAWFAMAGVLASEVRMGFEIWVKWLGEVTEWLLRLFLRHFQGFNRNFKRLLLLLVRLWELIMILLAMVLDHNWY